MRGLRQLVLDTIRLDPAMNNLGIDDQSTYPIYVRDSTPIQVEGNTFLIIRWGASEPGIGASIPCEMSLWAYCRNPDYNVLMDILRRGRVLMEGLIAQRTFDATGAVDGAISGVDWQGGSPDLFDDLYGAYTRNESYRIVASGN
jgi:hypothetical protein